MADDDPTKTPLEAHTPADAENPGDLGDDQPGQLTLTDPAGDSLLSSTLYVDGQLPLDREPTPEAPRARGKGRPKGSKNKTTDQLSKYLLAKGYQHPAEVMAQLISMPATQLAKEMSAKTPDGTLLTRLDANGKIVGSYQVEPLDALKVQVKAAEVLLPYFASKKPQDVNVDVRQRSLIVFGELPDGVAEDEVIDALSLNDFMQEDQ